MSVMLPPPPVNPLTNTRSLYEWLYTVYTIINGDTGEISVDPEVVTGSPASRVAALESKANDAYQSSQLLSAPVQQLSAADLQSAQIAVMRAQIAAMRSQVDSVILMTRPQAVARQFSVIKVTAAHYVKPGEFVDVDASGGAVTVTLPDAASNVGKLCGVAKNDSSANNVTVSGSVNGAASTTINLQYMALLFVSVGTEWRLW